MLNCQYLHRYNDVNTANLTKKAVIELDWEGERGEAEEVGAGSEK